MRFLVLAALLGALACTTKAGPNSDFGTYRGTRQTYTGRTVVIVERQFPYNGERTFCPQETVEWSPSVVDGDNIRFNPDKCTSLITALDH